MANASPGSSSATRAFVLMFGGLCYMVFLGAFLYQIGFLGNWLVPKGIDDGAASSMMPAVGIDLILLSFFAIQHTIMARHGFKKAWAKIFPKSMERSLFVLLASLILLLINWQWVPLPESVWEIEGVGATILHGICAFGWITVLLSTFLINHFDLCGIRQVWLYFRGVEYTEVPFVEGKVYSWVRHPIMLGFLIAFWATPHMSQGHLLFATVTTIYTLVGVRLEEKTLGSVLGEDYQDYRRRVSMIVPWKPKTKA